MKNNNKEKKQFKNLINKLNNIFLKYKKIKTYHILNWLKIIFDLTEGN